VSWITAADDLDLDADRIHIAKFYHSAALAPDELDALFPAGYGDNIHWHVVCVGRRPGLYASA
jgi:hypothetical protein